MRRRHAWPAVLIVGWVCLVGPQSVRPQGPTAAATTGQVPSVRLETVVPSTVNVGQPLAYEIVVRNVGSTAVYQVRVEDELPGGTHYLGSEPAAELPGGDRLLWNVGVLDAGAEKRIRVRVRPTAEGEMYGCATVTFAATSRWQARVARPKLDLSVTAPAEVQMGEGVALPIRATNTGSGPAANVRLRVRLPEGLRHPQGDFIEADLGTLAPGAGRDVTLRATAVRPGLQPTEVTVMADDAADATRRATVHVLSPALSLRQTCPTSCPLQEATTLTLEVANPGSAPCAGVRVWAELPAGVQFVSASADGRYAPAERVVAWQLGELPPGTPCRLTVAVRAVEAGDWQARSLARAEGDLRAEAGAVVRVRGVPALGLEVVEGDDPLSLGGETTVEVRVVNRGTCPCGQLRLTVTVPEGLAVRAVEGPTAHQVQERQLTFEPFARLQPRADVVYRLRVQARRVGELRWQVQAGCDELPEGVRQTKETRVVVPAGGMVGGVGSP